ncbi:type 1 fimbrial protein [Serratia marcescens]|uniref:fimbrial protein n=1 Tax=Serratia marcescens TaxID=615 RepID=UPI002238908B|nr:fimbrial protein [Serratia marcescens]MCW6025649.1 type 1 fimbrial protein [Serratia marcescens]
MKKTFLAVMMAGSTLMAINAAHAADGTVKFTGNITADACTVDTASKNQTVVLGDVATTSFAAAGDKSSPTPFQIKLTNCPANVDHVQVKFDGTSDAVNSDLLKLDAGQTATNVGIEIADSTATAIPLHTASPSYPVTDGTATLNFVGRYVSTAASVGAGSANGTSQFTINYQ